jgi:hypothetical protein
MDQALQPLRLLFEQPAIRLQQLKQVLEQR